MNDEAPLDAYRVTIRYRREVQQYEIFELEAGDLREAMSRALDRFPEEIVGSADLVEVRRANPAADPGSMRDMERRAQERS